MSISLYVEPTNPCSTKIPIVFKAVSTSTDITTIIQAKVYYRRNAEHFYALAGTKTGKQISKF